MNGSLHRQPPIHPSTPIPTDDPKKGGDVAENDKGIYRYRGPETDWREVGSVREERRGRPDSEVGLRVSEDLRRGPQRDRGVFPRPQYRGRWDVETDTGTYLFPTVVGGSAARPPTEQGWGREERVGVKRVLWTRDVGVRVRSHVRRWRREV